MADPCEYQERDGFPRFTNMDSIHAALTSCPNITLLDLRITGTTTGTCLNLPGTCVRCNNEWPSRWNFPFSPNGSDTYPPLKTLRLRGHDFDWIDDKFQGLPQGSTWHEGQQNRHKNGNLELWLDAMNWSQIEEFALVDHFDTPDPLKKYYASRPPYAE
jgi:hypothetical protein